ncbi:FixH family protein [Simiduia agarivorans]|uniref:Nitrogen fixation protein FixH n=1 Tax=Simiduia agarivorans (strain DSM 21679 / JCM 13881 / BCRC 17597 / SA1) TaxID=1117647 RepID=K4KXX9_SIMAS|nr:FixH family protein [Simiduia agarivorans]AFU98787.1 hypothetical protein M5M_07990 [Simiduia agarivorans SA1 = DSM 21679]
MQQDSQSPKPWYRQPWAWFLLTPLITIVIVMTAFISVSIKMADDVVVDNYSREGRMYNERLEQDMQARALNMQADISFDMETFEAWLNLTGEDDPESLVLLLQHPTEADLDQVVVLKRTATGRYRGDLDAGLAHRRYLQLFAGESEADRTSAGWRLKAELNFSDQQAVVMVPLER